MPAQPPQHARVAELTEARRLELGLLWEQVAEIAGIGYETIRAIRRGESRGRPLTRRQLALALRWEPDAFDRIDAGETPVPLRDGSGRPPAAALQAVPPLPPSENPWDEELARLLALHINNPVVQGFGAQEHKTTRMRATEILDWLERERQREHGEGRNGATG